MTQRSIRNNTNVSLNPFGVFTGGFEVTSTFLEISVYVNSTEYLAIGIQQSLDASNVNINTTYNYAPTNDVVVFNTAVGLPYYRIVVTNEANVQVGHMSVVTILTAIPSATTAPTSVSITGVVDVSGNVVATNLITETLATRRVDYLVVGNWYRVASVGITTGAEWNQIGAIVNGESIPTIGRLFKCLQLGPGVQNAGECYDVEYTDDVNATITNFPAFPAVQAVSGTVSLTNPTTVRISDFYGNPTVTSAGNLMVGINNIYTVNPLHTIVDSGTIGLSTSANTIKIDQTSVATNGVRTIAPDTSSVRVTTASSTGVEVNAGGHLLSFLAVNTSATADAYVKLYDSVSAPIPASDVPLLIAHVSRDAAARLPSTQVDTSNLKITNKLWVRAVTGAADTNTDVTGLSMDICFFVTAT